MCRECHMSRCSSRCPMAPEPPAVTTCYRCKEPIIPGDEYAHIYGVDYCEMCLEDMPYSELVTLMGGEWKTAREEDIYDGYDG